MPKPLDRLDANESVFFTRELEKIKTKSYDVKFKDLDSKKFIPVSTDAGPNALTLTWRSYDQVGIAQIVASYAGDIPRVDVFRTENTIKLYDIAAQYGYSIREIRSAQMGGVPLTQRSANAARKAHEIKQDDIAWNGDSDYSIQGLIDYPGITEYTVPAGAATTKTWATKTPDEILADLTGIKNAVNVPTNGKENINQILLPREQYNLINDLRMTGGSDVTILGFFLKGNPGVAVDPVNELDGAGASGTDRYFGYVRDVDHLTQELPVMFETLPMQAKGLEFEINTLSRAGGVIVYYVESIAFGDGI